MEYIMEKCLRASTHHIPENIIFSRSEPDGDGIYKVEIFDECCISSFRILPYKKTPTAYFFDWQVFEPGKGTGTKLFPEILSYLSKDYDNIKLQVSSKNTAAYKIYSRFGLEITESAD